MKYIMQKIRLLESVDLLTIPEPLRDNIFKSKLKAYQEKAWAEEKEDTELKFKISSFNVFITR